MDENSKIEQIKKMYPEGTKIKLNYMKDNYNPVPSRTQGIVDHVDDAGQIHVKWENGSSLALLYDEDDFEIINEKTIEKAFERKIKYIDNFDKSAEKESTIAELKKEIEVKWFYHAEANAGKKEEESYEQFINWTRDVIKIHDMSDDEFVDKILYGHSNFASIEDIGIEIVSDNANNFRYEIMHNLLINAVNMSTADNNMCLLSMTIEKTKDLIELSNEEFINKFYKLNHDGLLTVDNYVNAIMKDAKEDAHYNKHTVIQSYESPMLIEYWNDYSSTNEDLPVNDFRLKIVDEYLQFADNNNNYMSIDDPESIESLKTWLNLAIEVLKMPEEQFLYEVENNQYENDNISFISFIEKNNQKMKVTEIDGNAYVTSFQLYDATDEKTEQQHNKEIENFEMYINEHLKNYKCYVLPEYTDLGHKNKMIDGYTDKLHDVFNNIYNSADIHSGVDLFFNKEQELVVKCYGSMYKYVPDDVTLEMITEYKIIPVNGDNEKINLFEEIFDNQQEQELEDELEFYIDLG